VRRSEGGGRGGGGRRGRESEQCGTPPHPDPLPPSGGEGELPGERRLLGKRPWQGRAIDCAAQRRKCPAWVPLRKLPSSRQGRSSRIAPIGPTVSARRRFCRCRGTKWTCSAGTPATSCW